jgi:hypothetical protein
MSERGLVNKEKYANVTRRSECANEWLTKGFVWEETGAHNGERWGGWGV